MAFNPNASNLSEEQIIQQVFEQDTRQLRVDAQISATISDVEIKDPVSGHTLAINADGSINVDTILTAAADSIKSWTQDGTGNPIGSTTGSLNVKSVSSGLIGSTAPVNALQMGAVDTNGNLQALTVDPAGKLLVDITGSSTITGTVSSNLLGLNSFQTSQYTVGTSAVQITPTPLTNRSSMSLKVVTTGTNNVYIGPTSGVTTGNGYIMFNGDSLQLDLTTAHSIYAIASAANQTVYVLEIGI